jgi:uncharacterized protein YcfJ
MKSGQTAVLLVAALSLSACSSRPREFAPTLNAVPADSAKYEADYQACRTMVAEGQRSGFGARVASGGVGVAAGVGLGAALAGGTGGTALGAMAAASATLVMAPFIGVASAWGLAKRSKNKKEREVKEATSLCLSELGYTVAGWKVAKDQKRIEPRSRKDAAKP